MYINTTPLFLEKIYQHYFWGNYPKAGIAYLFFLVYFYTIFSRCLLLFYNALSKKKDLNPIARNRIKYIFAAFTIAALFGSTDYISNYNIEVYPIGYIGTLIFTFLFVYSIARYRFMEIHLIFRKTMIYSLAAGFLTSLFVVLVLAMTKYFSNIAGVTSFSITVVAALIIAFLFNPLKIKVQEVIDRIFYKTTYDYYATIQKVSHDLVASIDAKEIYKYIVDTVFTTLKLKNACLLISDSKQYESVYARPQKEKSSDENPDNNKICDTLEFVAFLSHTKEAFIKEELPRIIESGAAEAIAGELKPYDGEAVVPIFIDNKLSLILILGEKLSGDIFSDEDVKLLNTISNQAAIAIKNASLYAEKIHSERLASIGMMAATLAHEIKNPLASIKVFTQLIPDKYYDREFRESFSNIVASEIQRIDGLITELLDFSKPTPIKKIRVDAQNLLNNTLDLVSKNFDESNIKILKKYHGNFNIAGDQERLKQALLNIFINSQQAMKAGGSLEVGLLGDDSNVLISIRDNGIGIPENIAHKIFDPFFTTKQRGAGLGLAISRKIIEDHGGRITVESSKEGGTEFVLHLPILKEEVSGVNYGTISSVKQ